MINRKRKSGFTLTEVLISAGILSVGFMLIAGAFPVGVKLTSMATERTIGSIAAQEAVAKIKIYGLDTNNWYNYFVRTADPVVEGLTYGRCFDYSNVALLNWADPTKGLTPDFQPVLPLEDEYYYPSTNLAAEKKYHWSALCRRTSTNQIQATIFVSRLAGPGVMYPVNPIPTDTIKPALLPLPTEIEYPQPYMIGDLSFDPALPDRLMMPPVPVLGGPKDYATYFREGLTLVDDRYCYLYTIQKFDIATNEIVLDRSWSPTYYEPPDLPPTYNVWVLPSPIKTPGTPTKPAILGGRWPCVWIFQDIIEVSEFSQIKDLSSSAP